MAGPSTEFRTKQQMREAISLPKVGVRYSNGAGGVKSFGVSDAGELGSLDAAFGAAAAGVRRGNDRNLRLAQTLNERKEKRLTAVARSAIGIEEGESERRIYLTGEETGASDGKRLFFGTDGIGRKGWHGIDELDAPSRGGLVGKTMNADAAADSSSRDSSSESGAWSYEMSRTAFKMDNETGAISFYNYYRTVYVSQMGRVVGASEEREVLVGTFSSKSFDDTYVFCAKPETETVGDAKVVKALLLAKPTEFQAVVEGQAFVDQLQRTYDSIKDDPLVSPEYKAEVLARLNAAKAALADAQKAILRVEIGKFSVKGEFVEGVLSKMVFGTQLDVEHHAGDATKVKTVETQFGCPYRS